MHTYIQSVLTIIFVALENLTNSALLNIKILDGYVRAYICTTKLTYSHNILCVPKPPNLMRLLRSCSRVFNSGICINME